jgi:hypothetical protein
MQRDRHLASGDLRRESAPLSQGCRASQPSDCRRLTSVFGRDRSRRLGSSLAQFCHLVRDRLPGALHDGPLGRGRRRGAGHDRRDQGVALVADEHGARQRYEPGDLVLALAAKRAAERPSHRSSFATALRLSFVMMIFHGTTYYRMREASLTNPESLFSSAKHIVAAIAPVSAPPRTSDR